MAVVFVTLELNIDQSEMIKIDLNDIDTFSFSFAHRMSRHNRAKGLRLRLVGCGGETRARERGC